MTGGVHRAASAGFGRAGGDYERGRPGYPADAVDRMAAALALGPGTIVLDLAAGTGKLTRELTATGSQVIAVEPVTGMREQLQATTRGARVLEGTAEHIPLPDAAVAAVTVAQAFHWFDTAAAAAEIQRVLAPEGRLAVIWNAWDEHVDWVAAMMEIIHAHVDDAPQQRTSKWPQELAATGRFGTLTEETFANPVSGDRDTLVARALSTSYIAALPVAGRDQVARAVLAVVDHDPLTAGAERFETPYTTHLAWCERR
ncbi:MAG: class I SAM-dependent methyltransferase [Actinomycetota bacterium]|nr:class I SAM-dependent methyltransferase [Actinomycetota bacterium]